MAILLALRSHRPSVQKLLQRQNGVFKAVESPYRSIGIERDNSMVEGFKVSDGALRQFNLVGHASFGFRRKQSWRAGYTRWQHHRALAGLPR